MKNMGPSLLLLTALLFPLSLYAADPQDVVLVKDLFTTISTAVSHNIGSDGIRPAFIKALTATCNQTAVNSGIADAEQADGGKLKYLIGKRVDEMLDKVPSDGPSRLKLLETIGRLVTTSGVPETIIAQWLGHEPPARPEKIPYLNGRFTRQITAAGTGSILPVPGQSRILEEVGGAGVNNGVAETGEWVRISIALENRGPQPWFSTSAYFEVSDPFVFIQPKTEYELSELHKTNEIARAEEWIFISSECPSPHPIEISIKLFDTWRAQSQPIVAKVVLQPVQMQAPLRANARLDTDVPGSSDGSDALELAPNLKFEYLQDFSSTFGAPVEASIRYFVPRDVAGLFSSFTLDDSTLLASPDGKLLSAGDDIDGTVASEGAFKRVLSDLSSSKIWFPDGQKGRLWLADDIDIDIMQPGAAQPATRVTLAPGTPQVPEWPKPKTLLELVRKHQRLLVHPVTPVYPQAIAAASGVELVFDSAGFVADYIGLYQLPRPDAPLSQDNPLHYRFRTYIALPVMAMLRPQVVRQIVKETVEEPEEAPPPEELEFYSNRFFVQPFALVLPGSNGFVAGFDHKLGPDNSVLGIFQLNSSTSGTPVVDALHRSYDEEFDVSVLNFGLGYRSYRPEAMVQPYFQTLVKYGFISYSQTAASRNSSTQISRNTASALFSGGVNINHQRLYLTIDGGLGLAYLREKDISLYTDKLDFPAASANGSGYYAYSRVENLYIVYDINFAIGFQW